MYPICKRLSTFMIVALTTACAYQQELQYTQQRTLSDFTKDMARELQAGADKYTNAIYDKQYTENDIRVYQTEIVPRAGVEAITRSYHNYCVGNGGQYRDGYCFKGGESDGLFYIHLKQIGHYAGNPDMQVTTYEAVQPGTSSVFKVAQRYGYVSQEDKRAKQARLKASAKRRQAERDRLREKALQEYERRKKLAVETRAQVIQRGTRVCPVDTAMVNPCETRISCYTADYNPSNNMLKVVIATETAWVPVSGWYSCGQ